MNTAESPVQPVLRDIVLIGGGHSHVGVLRRFGMQPDPKVRLTVICNSIDTPYSGMLPGYVAGHYAFDEVHIHLPKLAMCAHARFLFDEVVGIDRVNQRVLCRHHPPVSYDVCSINIGSTPQMAQVPGAEAHAIAVKPIPQFNARWLALLARVQRQPEPLSIAVIGAGAGGVELCLAMQYRLQRERQQLGGDPSSLHFHLFGRDAELLKTHNPKVRRLFARTLHERGIQVHLETHIVALTQGHLHTHTGDSHTADEVVWVTQAGGATWLRDTGLALDAQGFVRVNAHLQSSDPLIFAAGDIASWHSRPLEKAGVFAVRMGLPLAENLRRAARGETALRVYRPQRHWLSLISTGNQYAVASRGPWALAGHWVWRWKDHIDRRFMRDLC